MKIIEYAGYRSANRDKHCDIPNQCFDACWFVFAEIPFTVVEDEEGNEGDGQHQAANCRGRYGDPGPYISPEYNTNYTGCRNQAGQPVAPSAWFDTEYLTGGETAYEHVHSN